MEADEPVCSYSKRQGLRVDSLSKNANSLYSLVLLANILY